MCTTTAICTATAQAIYMFQRGNCGGSERRQAARAGEYTCALRSASCTAPTGTGNLSAAGSRNFSKSFAAAGGAVFDATPLEPKTRPSGASSQVRECADLCCLRQSTHTRTAREREREKEREGLLCGMAHRGSRSLSHHMPPPWWHESGTACERASKRRYTPR
jgi:hypothetical protein